MKKFNKANAPYIVSSTLAIATLLASGVFAAAPYVGLLAPVVALGVSLPLIIGAAVFSAVVIAFSAIAMNKNKTISNQAEEIKDKDRAISEKDAQLANQAEEIKDKDRAISEKDAQLANQAEKIEGKDKLISEKDTVLEKKISLDRLDSAPSNLSRLDVKISDPKNKLTKANGYNEVNRFVYQAGKATLPLATAAYLLYTFYNNVITPVPASFDNIDVDPLLLNQGITSSVF